MQRPRVPAGLIPNYGSRNRFPTTPAPGGFSTQNNVQLISARVVDPVQWVVTLQPMVQSGFQALPWDAPWDGQNLLPITGHVPQADSSIPFRVRLTWGAGGVRGDAFFDYPVAGGSFGVVADTLDLTVFNVQAPTSVYADESEVPVFGAFMVPGVSVNQLAPMNLTDAPSYNTGVGDVVRWSVKPFARRVWISQLNLANAAVRFAVSFPGAGGNDLWGSNRVVDGDSVPTPIVIPNGSTTMRVENLAGGGGGQLFQPLWEIQLL